MWHLGSDIDGDELTYVLTSNPSRGSVILSGNVVTYTPDISWSGSDSFTFSVSDGIVESSAALVIIGRTTSNIQVVWSVNLRVTNFKGTTISLDTEEFENYSTELTFGFADGADEGIDLLETERPPLPPRSIFDARFQITGSNGSFLDYRPSDLMGAMWNLSIQSGTYNDLEGNTLSAYPIILEWNGANFLEGSLYLLDSITNGGQWATDGAGTVGGG